MITIPTLVTTIPTLEDELGKQLGPSYIITTERSGDIVLYLVEYRGQKLVFRVEDAYKEPLEKNVSLLAAIITESFRMAKLIRVKG